MFNPICADGPFRLDLTFALPSGISFEAVQGINIGNMSVISPAVIEATQEGSAESLSIGQVGEAPKSPERAPEA